MHTYTLNTKCESRVLQEVRPQKRDTEDVSVAKTPACTEVHNSTHVIQIETTMACGTGK